MYNFSSIIGKVVDLVVLDRLSNLLFSSESQFGFINSRSTLMCTMLLKETVSYYTNNDSSVYCILLDATKAFDRIQYSRLLEILLDRNFPALVNRLRSVLYLEHLYHLYLEQKTQVNWNGVSTESFFVFNGVKQGGILSPILFCLYIDRLTTHLHQSGVECYMVMFRCLGIRRRYLFACPSGKCYQKNVKDM